MLIDKMNNADCGVEERELRISLMNLINYFDWINIPLKENGVEEMPDKDIM